jgi:tungstate transport system substrate-binding protein
MQRLDGPRKHGTQRHFVSRWFVPFVVAHVALTCGCASKSAPSITLATTTSVQDSGLLDELVPRFREQTGIEVKVIAVGTGQALQLARRGDADAVIVHDPESEQQFVNEGHSESRRQIMHNDFVVVGPRKDPAGVRGTKLAVETFQRIAAAQATFISRGDQSGTHLREKMIWRKANLAPEGGWFVQGGAGMGAVLRMADEKRAYTLSDRGTFLALRDQIDLTILAEGDPVLLNRYSVIVVNPEKHSAEAHARARRFAEFLADPGTQEVIGQFGMDRFGEPLFVPDANNPAAAEPDA